MNFLAIDTSGKRLVVAASCGARTEISDRECVLQHSVLLMDEVDGTLSRAGMRLSDCNLLACTVGPGSFTGIRIGISAVKGLALGADKPVLSVTSFDAVAYADKSERKIVAIDAGHGCVYAKGYGVPLAAGHYPCEQIAALAASADAPVLSAEPLPIACRVVGLGEGLVCAVRALCGEAGTADELTALYLRKSSAEEKR